MFYQFRNYKVKIPFPLIDIYLFRWGNTRSSSGIHNHAKHGCLLFLFKGLKEKLSISYKISNLSLSILPFSLKYILPVEFQQ